MRTATEQAMKRRSDFLRERIIEIGGEKALDNPTIHGAMAMVDSGVTVEEVLLRAAVSLAMQYQCAMKNLIDIHARGLPPIYIVSSQEQIDKLVSELPKEGVSK